MTASKETLSEGLKRIAGEENETRLSPKRSDCSHLYDNVKSFDGGRTPVESDIFANVTANYHELVEVKASYEGGDWRARNRQEYRYIIGRRIAPRSQNDVIIGIARYTQGKNDFKAFFPF
ncbi:hypothetical protein BDV33DRAFT_162177 [Aspergillus novoparasiticus]|uniref:Uncharacterized protein n=1 Tax=Aspergillus novoparasiticus TaxID=986946 RepID=A0A5N6FB98_9EURO|nr:hypothetical protein BDV33DRAFT_162177 [Aspergillus novoparasiticus]